MKIPGPNPVTPAIHKKSGLFYYLWSSGSTRVLGLACYNADMPQDQVPSPLKKSAAFIGLVMGTALVGFVFGLIAAFIGASIFQGDSGGFGSPVGALAGMIIGYPIGVMIGIFVISKLLRYRGSLLLGVVGSILGVVIPIGLAELLDLNANPDLLWVLILLMPPLLGTAGFHLMGRRVTKEAPRQE